MTHQSVSTVYAALDVDTQAFMSKKAGEIKSRMQRSAQDVFAIGQALLEVKERLGRGFFLRWIEAEFSMSDRTAERFMKVAQRFADKFDMVSNLPLAVLYLLSSGKVSDEEVEQVISGQIPAETVRQRSRGAETQEAEETEEAEKGVIEYTVEGVMAFYNAYLVSASDDELTEAVEAAISAFDDEDTDVRPSLAAMAQAILDAVG